MSSLITLNASNVNPSQTNIFNYNFPSGSVKFKNARVAIQSVIIPYSWYNLNATTYNNTSIQLTFPVTISSTSIQQTVNITIPNGFYQISDINNYLQSQMISLGYYLVNAAGNNVYYLQLVGNINLNNAQLNVYPVPTSLPAGYSYGSTGTWGAASIGSLPSTSNQVPQLVTLNNNFGKLIGFASSTTFPSSTTSATTVSIASTLVPQITPVQSIYIGCSLVRNILSNPTNIITNVAITSTYATNIIYNPQEFAWLPILDGNIPSFQVIFYDNLFNVLPIIDTNLTVNLLIELLPENNLNK